MGIQATYLGMPLDLNDLDVENLAFFKHCAAHDFHLQKCSACGLLRYPPTTACPWCMSPRSEWVAVEGKGAVHSYTEVHHAIQPAFKAAYALPYPGGRPRHPEGQAQRARGPARRRQPRPPDGTLAPADVVRRVGIGTRVRMVFSDVTPGLALPQWTIDEAAPQPDKPWRYPQE